jgi:hypothetical protein
VIGDAIVTSPGVRLTGKLPGRLDYTAEGILQRGSYSADRISARAATGLLGWTVAAGSWNPRISIEYNYASGDPAARDFNRNTFDQFYPSNHNYYGMIDQFGWKNMKNFRAGFDFVVARKLKVRTDFNQLDLATVQDSLYNSGGGSAVLNRGAHQCARRWRSTAALYQKTGLAQASATSMPAASSSSPHLGYTYPTIWSERFKLFAVWGVRNRGRTTQGGPDGPPRPACVYLCSLIW